MKGGQSQSSSAALRAGAAPEGAAAALGVSFRLRQRLQVRRCQSGCVSCSSRKRPRAVRVRRSKPIATHRAAVWPLVVVLCPLMT